MKKIMFNDKYGLTQAVLEGRKTQTRRIISKEFFSLVWDEREDTLVYENSDGDFIDIRKSKYCHYKEGKIVAIARSYKDMSYGALWDDCLEFEGVEPTKLAGWNNKMFVRADYMLHRIRINKVRIQRLLIVWQRGLITMSKKVFLGVQQGIYLIHPVKPTLL